MTPGNLLWVRAAPVAKPGRVLVTQTMGGPTSTSWFHPRLPHGSGRGTGRGGLLLHPAPPNLEVRAHEVEYPSFHFIFRASGALWLPDSHSTVCGETPNVLGRHWSPAQRPWVPPVEPPGPALCLTGQSESEGEQKLEDKRDPE